MFNDRILEFNNPLKQPVVTDGRLLEKARAFPDFDEDLFSTKSDARDWAKRNGDVTNGVLGLIETKYVVILGLDGNETKIALASLSSDDRIRVAEDRKRIAAELPAKDQEAVRRKPTRRPKQ